MNRMDNNQELRDSKKRVLREIRDDYEDVQYDIGPVKKKKKTVKPGSSDKDVVKKKKSTDETPRQNRVKEPGEAEQRRRRTEANGDVPVRRRRQEADSDVPVRRKSQEVNGDVPVRRRQEADSDVPVRRKSQEVNGDIPVRREKSQGNPERNPERNIERNIDRKSERKPERKSNSKKSKRSKKSKKGDMIFWVAFSVYALILVILGFAFLRYTDKCLVTYENSQSVYAMEKYYNDFSAAINSGSVPPNFNAASFSDEFDTTEEITAMYLSDFNGKELSFAKAADSYNTEAPEYIIYAGDKEKVRVTLEGTNPKTIFGILTVMDWQVANEEYYFASDNYSCKISIPADFTVQINGKQVSDAHLSGEQQEIALFQYAKEYTTLPGLYMNNYEISGLVKEPEIQIFDQNGQQVEYTYADGVYSAFYKGSDEVPDEYKDGAFTMAKTWSLFMSNDLTGNSHGFGEISKYLIKDSYYYKMAHDWATGVDITFTSAHTLKKEAFTNVIIDDFVKYNDNCYSCHISFEKNMILTRNNEERVDSSDSTYIFVNYDDTDDGQDNPHWAIVDMIANTN